LGNTGGKKLAGREERSNARPRPINDGQSKIHYSSIGKGLQGDPSIDRDKHKKGRGGKKEGDFAWGRKREKLKKARKKAILEQRRGGGGGSVSKARGGRALVQKGERKTKGKETIGLGKGVDRGKKEESQNTTKSQKNETK